MRRGGAIFVSTAVLAMVACAGQQGELQVRSKATALAPGKQPVPYRIAEARGQLALGNVALALESFRKARRDDPNSIDALAGMAACYDLMGRYDLSRRNYEAALALAPADQRLLGAFASSLDLQGRSDEALKVRREIAIRSAMAAAQPQATAEAAPEAAVPAQPKPPSVASARPVEPVAANAPKPPAIAAAPIAVANTPQPPAPSVTIKLPPARIAPVAIASAKTQVASNPAASTAPARRTRSDAGPRLERLSMVEIALVTAPGPVWSPTTIARSARSTTVRFVPLRQASAASSQVRLLNAARVHRLAARTRSWLSARGWRGMAIGDAAKTRSESLILYPQAKRALAQRLSAQFGFAMAPSASGGQVTVLLGRDAALHPALRPARA